MEKFFRAIYNGLEGNVGITTRDEAGGLTDEKWFKIQEEFDRMVKYIKRRDDEDVYAPVAVFSSETRTKHDAKAQTRVVWADADTCHPDNFRIPPSIVVETSPDRWHVYWLLDETVPVEKAAMASQRVYLAHADQGCDSGWTASKLLRVPDTTNRKRDVPFRLKTEYYLDNVYTLDTFESVYSDVTPTSYTIASTDLPEPVTPEEWYNLEKTVDDLDLGTLYYNAPSEEQEWSDLLFRLETDLFRGGLTPREVFWLANSAACNKYKRDNRPQTDLWKDVQKSHQVFLDEEDVDPIKRDAQTENSTSFLTIEERKRLESNPCFIDEYMAWATSKTDAAHVYHRSLGYMLLSQVFGGRARLKYKFDTMNLNLWVSIAGDTTLTRKSTAKRLMLKMLRSYEANSAFPVPIDIGSDTTAEGITSKLGEQQRDGMPALILIDEFHGWLHGTMAKNHMAGALERFTDLYDGQVPVVLRATAGAGNPRRNDTSFSLLGIGIRESYSKVLTKEHFASGFLARMLWSVADTPPYTDSMGEIPWAGEEDSDKDKAEVDPERDRIVKRLIKAGNKFPWSKERVIKMTPDAKKRFDEWSVPLSKETYYSQDSDVLFPTIERMKFSIMKSAALLAMADSRDTVELLDVLHALAQGELWYRDARRMASEISSTDYESKLDEVEKYIATGTGGTRKDAAVRRQFARYRASEFDDIITSLRKQGRVRYRPENRQIIEAL